MILAGGGVPGALGGAGKAAALVAARGRATSTGRGGQAFTAVGTSAGSCLETPAWSNAGEADGEGT